MSVASEDQKADLEQVAQSLEEIIELTQSSILNESQEDDENSLLKEESHLEVSQQPSPLQYCYKMYIYHSIIS